MTISVQVPAELDKRLRAAAKRAHLSKSDIMRRLLREGLEREEQRDAKPN